MKRLLHVFVLFLALPVASCSSGGSISNCAQESVEPRTIKEMIERDWYAANHDYYKFWWKDWSESGANLLPMKYTGVFHSEDACWIERYFGKYGACYAITIYDHNVEYKTSPSSTLFRYYPMLVESDIKQHVQFYSACTTYGAEGYINRTVSGNVPMLYRSGEFFTLQEAVDFSLISTDELIQIMQLDANNQSGDIDELMETCPKTETDLDVEYSIFSPPPACDVYAKKYAPEFAETGAQSETLDVYVYRHGAFFSIVESIVWMSDPTGGTLINKPKDYFWPVIPLFSAPTENERELVYRSPSSYLPMIVYLGRIYYPDIIWNTASPFFMGDYQAALIQALNVHLSRAE